MNLKSSYPPPADPPPWSSESRSLLPILEPQPLPDSKQPVLPSPPRRSLIDEWYSLSTHLLPAAFPRSTPDVGYPPASEFSPLETKQERLNKALDLRDKYFELKVKHWNGTLTGNSEKRLWICVNRYVHKQAKSKTGNKMTLFLCHANGFMKEVWEPMLKHLGSTTKRGDVVFDEIWAWEAINHGDSALVNEDNLCALFDWTDNTRDMLNFMLNYIPDSLEELPVHLPKVSSYVSQSRKERGFDDRTLVGLGHSFCGNSITLAAIHCPILFSSLVLVDPIIMRPPYNEPWINRGVQKRSDPTMLEAALLRRNRWSSKEEAMNSFKQNPFFAIWDPSVLEIYVECALYEDEHGVRLKTSPECETAVYAERRTWFQTWDLLPTLDERIELRFIMPGRELEILESEKQQLTWLRPKNTSNVRLMHAGHLIVHEAPKDLACEVHEFVQRKYGQTKARI